MRFRSGVRTVGFALASAVAIACGSTGSTAPSSSTLTNAPTVADSSTVEICHRGEAGAFTKIAIPTGTTATHLAHGDGFPGHFLPGNSQSRFDGNCAVTPVVIVTITFAALTTSGAAVAPFEESGFYITAVDGSWEQYPASGAPAPSAVFKRPASNADTTAAMEVRPTAGLFAFAAVDLYSSVTPIPYTIVGRFEGKDVLLMSGTVPNTFGKFATLANPNAPQMIDSLMIRLTNPATICCANPTGLDNIVLKR